MTRIALTFALAACAAAARAALTSAAWGTDPAAPIYVGQAYDLTLTIETDPDEEIAGFVIDQGPSRNPDSQTSVTQGGRRRTVFRWREREDRARIAAIPLTRLVADVTQVQTFGFMRTATSSRQGVGVEAFSYEVRDLPGEAAGAPIGAFALTLAADPPTFRPGDVLRLTATLTAEEGLAPADFPFALEPTDAGAAYPFRVVERTEKRLVAQGYFAVAAEAPFTLRLRPARTFDLRTRTLTETRPATLALTLAAPDADDAAPDADTPIPLRLAPAHEAPTLGTLPPDAAPEILERHGGWVRVRHGERTGWVRKGADHAL